MWRVWGRRDGCTGFWWGNLRERDHWGGPDVDEKLRDRWRALVSTVMNLRVPKMRGIS